VRDHRIIHIPERAVIREAIVLAGGFGTRLQPVVRDVPKSMAPVNGRPFLEYLFDYIISGGIGRVVLSVGYKSESIETHFGRRYRDLEIDYAKEIEPLGTGGGIRNAFRLTGGAEAFVLNGDSLFMVDLGEMERFHRSGNALLTMALRYLEDSGRYGSVRLDAMHRIRGFEEKNSTSGPGYINGGVYILNKEFMTGDLFPEKFSLEKDCFEKFCGHVSMLGFPSEGYFLDIGIPEDYEKANNEFGKLEH
jgi:D-glycero-alpha-D-manno-heptose 1-phosphate guanylyltransferase